MKRLIPALLSALLAVLFTFLFYRQSFGLNVLIFEWAIVLLTFKKAMTSKLGTFSLICLFLSSLSIVFVHSALAAFMNYISLLIYCGNLCFSNYKSVQLSGLNGGLNFVLSQGSFAKSILSGSKNSKNIFSKLWNLRFYILPVVFILIFIGFYRNSNPKFNNIISSIESAFPDFQMFSNFNFVLAAIFILGVLISNAFLFPNDLTSLSKWETSASEELIRKRPKLRSKFKNLGLLNELKSGVFLFAALNLILLLLNFLDIYYVWFNFSWGESTLKEFVHEGTWFLICSILISIGLVLFYFRGNINFFSKNIWIKKLATIWLIQNIVLAVSVIIRNLWYVKYFSLAHLRIGLFIFILIVMIGLWSVLVKINSKKSFYYLFRWNGIYIYSILLICSFVDWDKVIAHYNVAHAGDSYYHFNYMANLSYKTLPIVDIEVDNLKQLDDFHDEEYYFERSRISPENYTSRIESRKKRFIEYWESTTWKSWNWPEHDAYTKLKKE